MWRWEVEYTKPLYILLDLQDCDDSSDEKNCRTINFDKDKYLNNKPPPPPKGKGKLPVTAR